MAKPELAAELYDAAMRTLEADREASERIYAGAMLESGGQGHTLNAAPATGGQIVGRAGEDMNAGDWVYQDPHDGLWKVARRKPA